MGGEKLNYTLSRGMWVPKREEGGMGGGGGGGGGTMGSTEVVGRGDVICDVICDVI